VKRKNIAGPIVFVSGLLVCSALSHAQTKTVKPPIKRRSSQVGKGYIGDNCLARSKFSPGLRPPTPSTLQNPRTITVPDDNGIAAIQNIAARKKSLHNVSPRGSKMVVVTVDEVDVSNRSLNPANRRRAGTGGEIERRPVFRSRRGDVNDERAGQFDGEGGLTDAFYEKLVRISANLQIHPEDILAVMYCESGLKASARNPGSNAVGLIQFIPATLTYIGFNGTADDFCRLGETEQLTWVERYLSMYQQYGLEDVGRVYQAVFMPASMRDASEILVDSLMDPAKYRRNVVLDSNGDGIITVSDLVEFINRKCSKSAYRSWLSQLRQVE